MMGQTAILIFSRSADAECRFKRFSGNFDFFKSQEKRLNQLCYRTHLDTYVFDETLQKGTTFGERFCYSVSEIFSKGYDNVIIIGNDSPQLQFQHLASSIKALQSHKACIGKTLDGGFYLLAIPKHQFQPSKFLALSWKSSKLNLELTQILEPHIGIDFLPCLKDIDCQNDFSNLLNFANQLYTDVILILKRTHCHVNFSFQCYSLLVERISIGAYQNKAPPLLLKLA